MKEKETGSKYLEDRKAGWRGTCLAGIFCCLAYMMGYIEEWACLFRS